MVMRLLLGPLIWIALLAVAKLAARKLPAAPFLRRRSDESILVALSAMGAFVFLMALFYWSDPLR
jgi:hypothetical protein